jgi:uncharacterized membrane protein
MQGVIELLKSWRLHPVVDHFTVALILIAIVTDLVASLASSRLWLRYMALTLMVLGAAAAVGSNFTGGWEAHRVWDNLDGPAKDLLKRHAWWGDKLPWVFGALAVWRLGLQFFGFLAPSRFIYLLVAIVAGGAILYQGKLGGDLVYDYGVGTALLSQTAPASAATMAPATPSAPAIPPAPIPTVYVPPPSPAMAPSPGASLAPPAPASPTDQAPVPSPATTPSVSTGSTPNSPPAVSGSAGAATSPESQPTQL